MSPTTNPDNDAKIFVERAREKRLVISIKDAKETGTMMPETEAGYAAIREIDTTGFEPAAIFVPAPSKRESN
jgi:hypothetical protein